MLTRIIIPFAGYPARYVWHCHILEHEDNEMMRTYEVIEAVKAGSPELRHPAGTAGQPPRILSWKGYRPPRGELRQQSTATAGCSTKA
ncbi:MAG: multicopper oxidase domain-containing protein [Candidatus Sulfotelmatobacter sp.]